MRLPPDYISEHDEVRDFVTVRGAAIAIYAHMEQTMGNFFAHLMGAQIDFAGVAFFRINNSRARNAMLERLLKKRHGDTYNLFWNSFVKLLQKTDEERNRVVHWITVSSFDSGKFLSIWLQPPNFWDRTPNTPKIGIDDIIGFADRCDFLTKLLEMFLFTLGSPMAFVNRDDARKNDAAWREIFQQPVAYPPPESHPLYRKRREPLHQRPPSRL